MSSNQPNFIDKAKAAARETALAAAKNTILKQAGKALGDWLAAEEMTTETMTARLAAGEPLLKSALGKVSAGDVARYRNGATQQAVAEIQEADFRHVLRWAAANPKAEPCATLLRTDSILYWKHFVPAMNAVKAWFVDGTPL